jgi:Leucine-rich repeat (LRR) protein
MSSLVTLDLSGNRLSALPRLLAAKLSKLQIINLSRNSFLNIPSVLKNLHQLRVIDLSYNEGLEVRVSHSLDHACH